MRLILIRHGNTFGPGDRVCWVGARSDLPLVEKGRAQATAVGRALAALPAPERPQHIFAGPLKRTRETAALIATELGLPGDAVETADALREIDYGTWEGLSNDDIRARHGDAEIDGWQKRGAWPEGFGWSPDPASIRAAWAALVADLPGSGPFAFVSSNGIYKLLAPLFGIAPEEAKMATGHVSLIELSDGRPRIIAWNQPPAALARG